MDNKNNALQCKKDLKWFHSRIEIFNADAQYHIDALTSSRRKIREVSWKQFNSICNRTSRIISKCIVLQQVIFYILMIFGDMKFLKKKS